MCHVLNSLEQSICNLFRVGEEWNLTQFISILLESLLLNALQAVFQAFVFHLFPRNQIKISLEKLSVMLGSCSSYEFHRSSHKLDIYPIEEFGQRILLWLHSVLLRLLSVLKSNSGIASKINHSSREAIVTAAEWAPVRNLIIPGRICS